MTFRIEGYDNLFEIVDSSKTQTTYGAICVVEGVFSYSFYITPFPDQVEPA